MVIARRLEIPMSFGLIYPNLNILWCADSTLYRKTTSLKIVRQLASKTFPYLLASQDATYEALFSVFAGQQPTNFESLSKHEQENWSLKRDFAAQKGWVIDKMSGLLVGANKDYNGGLAKFYYV